MSDPGIAPQAAQSDVPLRHGHVIVAGFGVVGRMVTEQLESAGVEVTVIELNPQTVERQQHLNRRVVLGDVADTDVLRQAGIFEADALIVAIPDEEEAVKAVRAARQTHPKIFIAARAEYVSRGLMCAQAGADCVIVEEVVTAEAMQRAVMEKLLGDRPAPALDGACSIECPGRAE